MRTATTTTQVELHTEESWVPPSLSTQRDQTFDGKFAVDGNGTYPLQPSSVPLPPSISGYSSPTSQTIASDTAFQQELQARLCGPMFSFDHTRASGPRQFLHPSLNVDTANHGNSYPYFDDSPLSTMPAVGTPLVARTQSSQSSDFRLPFSPRPEGTRVFTARVNGRFDRTVQFIGEDSDASSFAHSPQLISPAVKLPSPVAGSPTGSDWTSDGGSVTKLSLNSCVLSSPVVKTASGSEESRSLNPSDPDFTLRVFNAGNMGG